MKKYTFIKDDYVILPDKIKLYRIQRISDGLIGGYIEKEENLSHEGECWVYDNAIVANNAIVHENAKVYGFAKIFDDAQILGDARILSNASIGREIKLDSSSYLCVEPIDDNEFLTIIPRQNYISTGFWRGSIEKFIKQELFPYEDTKYEKDCIRAIKYAFEQYGVEYNFINE